MTITAVFLGVPTLAKLQGNPNDDWADRLNHVWTVIMFCVFAIIVCTGQFVGEAIHCWCPAHFTAPHVLYIKNYCWVKNTYYLAMEDPIPIEKMKRVDEELAYYQWAIYILLFQAFMFKLPNIVWWQTQRLSGINLDIVVRRAMDTQLGSSKHRNEVIESLAENLDGWLEAQREYRWNTLIRAKHKLARYCRFFCNKRAGTYLTGLYLSIKVMYAVNVIAQFFILNAFLSTDFNFYGFEVLANMGKEDLWMESPRFPRVTLCDFRIRQLENVQDWTLQCVLPINRFNEKIFIFIWFWLVLVAFLTCLSLVGWLYSFLFKRPGVAYIKKCLKIKNKMHTGFDKKLCRSFTEQYLRDDGVFIMRVIAKNSTGLVVTDLVDKMWDRYKNKSQPKLRNNLESTLPPAQNDSLTGTD